MTWVTALNAPTAGYEGQFGSDPKVVESLIAGAACRAGLCVARGRTLLASSDTVGPMLAMPIADNDSIYDIGDGVTAVIAGQTLVGGTGAIGQGRIFPPARMTYTFSNSPGVWGIAALGGSWCRTTGLGPDGQYQVEDWFMPAAGNAVVTTDKSWSKHFSSLIGACDAAGGGSTLLIGTAATTFALGRLDYGFAGYDLAAEPSATATVTYDAGDVVPVLEAGTIWVTNETTSAIAATPGDPVAVRYVVAGNDVRGQVSVATAALLAGGSFALLEGAYFVTAAAAGALALIRIGG
jgi:hypothetical protein